MPSLMEWKSSRPFNILVHPVVVKAAEICSLQSQKRELKRLISFGGGAAWASTQPMSPIAPSWLFCMSVTVAKLMSAACVPRTAPCHTSERRGSAASMTAARDVANSTSTSTPSGGSGRIARSSDKAGAEVPVDFLRVGRIALVYKTRDAQEYGVWDQVNKAWQTLDSSDYANWIDEGLRVAKKQSAPHR